MFLIQVYHTHDLQKEIFKAKLRQQDKLRSFNLNWNQTLKLDMRWTHGQFSRPKRSES